jgi:two-component system, OmpR family, phosphate regulon sensor histidine kinase PhoR
VHTLLDGAMDDENVKEKFLKKAAKSLDGLNILVQDLLLLSQIETGELKMQFVSFDIQKLCEEVVEQLEHKAEKRDVKLRLKSFYGVIVKGDKMRIYQVIVNLVDNAIKYGGNSVEIAIERNKDQVEIAVSDNGVGIQQEHLKRIFDRFYRIEKSRNRDKGGTGLGLSIVKNVIDAHNSKIQVQSKIGKGTTFAFKLQVGVLADVVNDD